MILDGTTAYHRTQNPPPLIESIERNKDRATSKNTQEGERGREIERGKGRSSINGIRFAPFYSLDRDLSPF